MKQLTVSAPFSHSELNDASVHVWWGDIQSCKFGPDNLAPLLSPDEKQRADRFVREKDRQRYIAVRGFLRQVLARYVETEPAQLRFACGVHGKPELTDAATGIEFNLSHAQNWFALAVSQRRSVGIDIEYSGTPRNCEAIAQSFFSVPEQRQLSQLPAGERAAAFLTLWTRKEALLKACGVGLAAPRDLAMAVPQSSHPLAKNIVTPFGGKLWRIYNLNLQPDLVCALAVQEQCCPTQVHVINAMEFWGG